MFLCSCNVGPRPVYAYCQGCLDPGLGRGAGRESAQGTVLYCRDGGTTTLTNMPDRSSITSPVSQVVGPVRRAVESHEAVLSISYMPQGSPTMHSLRSCDDCTGNKDPPIDKWITAGGRI